MDGLLIIAQGERNWNLARAMRGLQYNKNLVKNLQFQVLSGTNRKFQHLLESIVISRRQRNRGRRIVMDLHICREFKCCNEQKPLTVWSLMIIH